MGDHVMFVGTPGVGKSTLLNTLIGSVQFPSGEFEDGPHFTKKRNTKELGAVKYTDTPGLAHHTSNEAVHSPISDATTSTTAAAAASVAADEVADALKVGGRVKLVFVVNYDAGHFRPSDLAAIIVVLNTVTHAHVDVHKKYSVIINKVKSKHVEKLGEQAIKSSFRDFCPRTYPVGDVLVLQLEPHAEGVDDVRLRAKDRLVDFIAKAPAITIEPGTVFHIPHDALAEQVQVQDVEMENIRREVEARKANLLRKEGWEHMLSQVTGVFKP